MHKKLFIPGPVDCRPEVLEAMGTAMIGHRSKDATTLQKNVSEKMQKVFHTKNPILLSTSSGTGLMEGSVRSLTAKRAVIFSVGAFGNRWHKLATSNGVPADLEEAKWGQPTRPETVDKYLSTGKYDVFTITHNETSTGVQNDMEALAEVRRKYPDILWLVDTVSSMGGAKVEVDKLGIDVCIASTQKALGLPPGLALAATSLRALEYGKQIKNRGTYLDLLELYKYIVNKPYQYPSTPTLSHMYALDVQLDYILNEEGLENRYARHKAMQDVTLDWANQHFKQFAAKGYESATVTAVDNIHSIPVADLNAKLGQEGFQISNGYGDLKQKTFRIAHMADRTLDELKEVLALMDKIIPTLK